MKKGTIALIVIAVLLVLWGFSSYNGLVRLNEQADGQWAQVETQYQRRLDLIPNLVNSVRGLMTQEQKVFGDIAAARTQYGSARTPDERAAAASNIETSLGRLLVVMENYPQLQSSATVQNLMSQLEGTENRVSVERGRFNDVIRNYNTSVKTFPRNIFAGIFGFHERHYFEAREDAANAPTVNLQ